MHACICACGCARSRRVCRRQVSESSDSACVFVRPRDGVRVVCKCQRRWQAPFIVSRVPPDSRTRIASQDRQTPTTTTVTSSNSIIAGVQRPSQKRATREGGSHSRTDAHDDTRNSPPVSVAPLSLSLSFSQQPRSDPDSSRCGALLPKRTGDHWLEK
uniref:Uncharacterized protein n=1 Tax=Anopheles albimanus TaxID=7167 RepID=A0A182FYL9_ANOAL